MSGEIRVIFEYAQTPENFYRVDVTSRSKTLRNMFSPFYLGPVHLPDGEVSQVMENAWQFSKVYADMADEDGNPTQAFFDWRAQGCHDTKAHRHPHKGKPLYAYWGGNRYGYIEARKHILIPIYYQVIMDHPEGYLRLKKEYESGKNIAITDFDGYDHKSMGMTYEDVVNNPNKVMGHGHIMAMMLEDMDYIQRILKGEA